MQIETKNSALKTLIGTADYVNCTADYKNGSADLSFQRTVFKSSLCCFSLLAVVFFTPRCTVFISRCSVLHFSLYRYFYFTDNFSLAKDGL
ncbi:MAG: hypothetical protein LUD00_06165 [Prevotellaceae bacterium]|nr:hypothetical protein [Prevotellaceae bacterium]